MLHNASLRFGLVAALVPILAGCAGAGPTTQSPNPSVAADGNTSPTTPGGASVGSPPEGSWQVVLTAHDLVASGWPADVTAPGTYTWTFGSDRARIDLDEAAGASYFCEAEMAPSDSGFRLTYDDGLCGGEVEDIEWTLKEDGLHLTLVETNAPLDQQKAYLETKPWQPVD